MFSKTYSYRPDRRAASRNKNITRLVPERFSLRDHRDRYESLFQFSKIATSGSFNATDVCKYVTCHEIL